MSREQKSFPSHLANIKDDGRVNKFSFGHIVRSYEAIKPILLAAQKTIDAELTRYSLAYVPIDKGDLKRSIESDSVYGSGYVCVGNTPYTTNQYYNNIGNNKDPLRGHHWTQRAAQDKKTAIMIAAAAASQWGVK